MTVDIDHRNHAYLGHLLDHVREEVIDGYPERVESAWAWDHSDEQRFLASIAEQREAWGRVLNPPAWTATGPVTIRESEVPDAKWLDVPVSTHLSASGVLLVPPSATRLVVFQHGLGSTPEKTFGVPDRENGYHGVARDLVDCGYAVLAPMNLITVELRNQAQDLARLLGTTMEGIELARCRVLLDAVAERHPELDADAVGMVGISWGGLAAQFWTPLEERFTVAVTMGFFNDRLAKMIIPDQRYSSFADTHGHHAYLAGHLDAFSDAELASMVCPRPFLVQHGIDDLIGAPDLVDDEFTRARRHWDLLGVGDRTELQFHGGGHEVETVGLLRWLARHFPAAVSTESGVT